MSTPQICKLPDGSLKPMVSADAYTDLERELNDAKAMLEPWREGAANYAREAAARRQVQAKLNEWKSCAERLANYLIEETDCEDDESCPCAGCQAIVKFNQLKGQP